MSLWKDFHDIHCCTNLEVREAALTMPVDHDRGGGGQGGVHTPSTAYV